MEKIWLHGDGCDCDKCNKNGDRYIVYDNDCGDMFDLPMPKNVGDEVVVQDQHEYFYMITRLRHVKEVD